MTRRYRFRRTRDRQLGGVAWIGLLLVILAVAGWTVGFVEFVDALPRQPAASVAKTDAIVVLTGGSRRLDAGVALLASGAAPVLFVSGVDERVDAASLRALLPEGSPGLSQDLADCCLVLGYGASDTIGNARETEIWMKVGNRTSLLLVTSNYHMPRAMLEFAHAMPGVRILPHAVIPPDVRLDGWYQYPGTLALLANEYTKYIFASMRLTVAGWFMALAT